MGRDMSASGSIVIAVDPDTVYDAVSDVRQMGRWSPENLGAVVEGDFDGSAYVGMRFVGANRRGPARWKTGCVVTHAERGQRFAFNVDRYTSAMLRIGVARWTYDFRGVEGGTEVTETWYDGRRRWPDFTTRLFDPLATGKPSFAEFQRGNIQRTLKRLKRELEGA